MKTILLAPLDPVHDLGLKMVARALEAAGHRILLMPPDVSFEGIIRRAVADAVDVLLLSRTLGYDVAELLARFADLSDAAGLREKIKIGIGGMAIRREIAAELGFDAGFGPGTDMEEVVCFVEEREYCPALPANRKIKRDMCAGYDYRYLHAGIAAKLRAISQGILDWTNNKCSPGTLRADLRHREWDAAELEFRQGGEQAAFRDGYAKLCGEIPRAFYINGKLPAKVRAVDAAELSAFEEFAAGSRAQSGLATIRHNREKPLWFIQCGTGCPMLDAGHSLAAEAWGADGVVHFDPSWGARTEGFLDGFLTQPEDGTVITAENLFRLKTALPPAVLWQVRAHRGLNTPETVVLAGKLGADLTKINFCYGMLGAGTDPARMLLDGCRSIQYAAEYQMAFDTVCNEELAGVPAHKALAGMLIVADLSLLLKGRPILQPLFAYSPEVLQHGWMDDNYIDFNAAKLYALRQIINAPVWPGAPVGFLTHSEDRVQSAMTTALHACLASTLQVDAATIASTDEAYAGGPITAAARIDTLRAVKEGLRFFGKADIRPTPLAFRFSNQLVDDIEAVLSEILNTGDFLTAIYKGILGGPPEGVYPGKLGRDTVKDIAHGS